MTLLAMLVLAIVIERVVLRPLVNQPQITLFMATIGVSFFLEGFAQGLMGHRSSRLKLGIPDKPFEFMGMMISQFDIVAAALSGVLVASLAVFFSKTRIGRALRAVADDHQAALTVGIPLQTIWVIVWSVAG